MTAPGASADPGQPSPEQHSPEQHSPEQHSPPTCYRHPDRESWVSCVRCGRHACPDCLRDASVGQQCVECVRDANRGSGAARKARTVFGGRARIVRTTAIVTWTIMGLNVLLYLVELVYPNLAYDWAMWPVAVAGGGQWYRLLTAAFLPPTGRNGLLDIAFNMWALYVVGPSLEQLLGRTRYIAVYLLSAVGGNLLYYFLAPPDQPALGASGAIFGLFAALFVVARRLRLNIGGIAVVIVANLIFSFVVANIAWQAHVGGLIVGAVLAAVYAYAPRKYQVPVQAAATIVILALLAVGIVIRNGQLLG